MAVPKFDKNKPFDESIPVGEKGERYFQSGYYYDAHGNHVPADSDSYAPARVKPPGQKPGKLEETKPIEDVDELEDESEQPDVDDTPTRPATSTPTDQQAPLQGSSALGKTELLEWAEGKRKIEWLAAQAAVLSVYGRKPDTKAAAIETILKDAGK